MSQEEQKEKLEKIVKDGIAILNDCQWGSNLYDETISIINKARFKLLRLESEELLK